MFYSSISFFWLEEQANGQKRASEGAQADITVEKPTKKTHKKAHLIKPTIYVVGFIVKLLILNF